MLCGPKLFFLFFFYLSNVFGSSYMLSGAGRRRFAAPCWFFEALGAGFFVILRWLWLVQYFEIRGSDSAVRFRRSETILVNAKLGFPDFAPPPQGGSICKGPWKGRLVDFSCFDYWGRVEHLCRNVGCSQILWRSAICWQYFPGLIGQNHEFFGKRWVGKRELTI